MHVHPTTHLLTGWCLAELAPELNRREKTAVVIAAAISDLDGLGMFAELATRNTSRPLLWWTDDHHVLAHNLLFATMTAIVVAAITRSWRAGMLSFIAVHLHILGDLAGSRGPDDSQRPIPYLYPSRDEPQLVWSGQWHLNAWPNFVITAVLMMATIALAWRRGYSAVGLVSPRADEVFIGVLRERFGLPEAAREK